MVCLGIANAYLELAFDLNVLPYLPVSKHEYSDLEADNLKTK